MKLFKCMAVAVVVMTVASSTTVRADGVLNDAAVAFELYVWNRVADLMEIFRTGAAIGPAIGAEIAVSESLQAGAYWQQEVGATWPNIFPPFWIITYLDKEQVFTQHQGYYKTYVFGDDRFESSLLREVRFPREPAEFRIQLALGLFQVYFSVNYLEVGDFVTGIFGVDLAKDDQVASKTIRREPARQFGRGLTNVLTGWWEIPINMIDVNKEFGGWAGATYGVVRGLHRTLIREGVGLVELITFPMGWSAIVEPEFPFQQDVLVRWKVNPWPFSQRRYNVD